MRGALAPTPLFDLPRCDLGEGPRWDVATQTLIFVDITGQAIHRVAPSSGAVETFATDAVTGFALLDERDRLVAGLGDGIHTFHPGSGERRLLARPDMHRENRFNDAGCDPRGRLWAGTMHTAASRDRAPTGALYRVDAGGLFTFATGIGIANGLGWSPDGGTMYFAETHLGTVWAYDYDLATGTPSHRRALALVDIDIGVPDGLTVDSRGRVYVAIWRGARINVYAPDGHLDEVIAMPVPSATSCCFGDADLRTLFITTDGRRLSGESLDDPLPGRILALRRDVPGQPCPRMRPLDAD